MAVFVEFAGGFLRGREKRNEGDQSNIGDY